MRCYQAPAAAVALREPPAELLEVDEVDGLPPEAPLGDAPEPLPPELPEAEDPLPEADPLPESELDPELEPESEPPASFDEPLSAPCESDFWPGPTEPLEPERESVR